MHKHKLDEMLNQQEFIQAWNVDAMTFNAVLHIAPLKNLLVHGFQTKLQHYQLMNSIIIRLMVLINRKY